MNIRHFLRVLARSKSLRFSLDVVRARTLARAGVRGQPLANLRWRGRDVFYRPATSDSLAIYQVLLRQRGKAEYYLRQNCSRKSSWISGATSALPSCFFTSSFPPLGFTDSNRTPKRFESCKKTSARFRRSKFSITAWARPTRPLRSPSMALISVASCRRTKLRSGPAHYPRPPAR